MGAVGLNVTDTFYAKNNLIYLNLENHHEANLKRRSARTRISNNFTVFTVTLRQE